MKRACHLIILGLVALTAVSALACGDDEDETTGEAAGGSTGEAVAPPPHRAFSGLATALEAQGLPVVQVPNASLNGAEAGVNISGDQRGSARSFATEAAAREYADEVAKSGEKTTIVGMVVFQAATKDDADSFAEAYEG